MSKSWYYVQDGKQFGPMPADVLHQLALAGVIKHNDKVRMEDMKEWAQAGSVKGLFLDISGQVSMPTVDGIGKAAEAVSSVAKSTGKVVDAALDIAETSQKIGKAISTVASLATGGSTFAGSIGDFLRPLGPVNFMACGGALLSGLTFWILARRATSASAKRLMTLASIGLACVGGSFALWTGIGAVAGANNKGFLATHVKVLEQLQERTILPKPKIGDVRQIQITDSLSIPFAWVPPGQSWLGGGDGKEGEIPFKLDKGFWCGIYEVTQKEWQSVMGNNPSYFQEKPKYPVELVSYDDILEYLKKANIRSKRFGGVDQQAKETVVFVLHLLVQKQALYLYILMICHQTKPILTVNFRLAKEKRGHIWHEQILLDSTSPIRLEFMTCMEMFGSGRLLTKVLSV